MLLFLLCCCEQPNQLKKQGSIRRASTHLRPASVRSAAAKPPHAERCSLPSHIQLLTKPHHPTAALSPDSVRSSPSPPLLSRQDSRPASLISPVPSFDSYPPTITYSPHSHLPLSYIFLGTNLLTLLNLFTQN